ncbi:hypothetical protein T31B1_07838 [Salinisphaera sp. T31B1]
MQIYGGCARWPGEGPVGTPGDGGPESAQRAGGRGLGRRPDNGAARSGSYAEFATRVVRTGGTALSCGGIVRAGVGVVERYADWNC